MLWAALGGCTLIMQGTSQDVTFRSTPEGASFRWRDAEYATPVTLALPKEEQRFVFTKEGYHPQEVALRLRTSSYFYWGLLMGVISSAIDVITGAWKEFESGEVHVELKARPAHRSPVAVRIVSEPEGADVAIDGTPYGRAPLEVLLEWSGEAPKSVTFRRAGYKTEGALLAKEVRELSFTMAKLVPTTFDSAPARAEVWVDGELAGLTPCERAIPWRSGDKPRSVEFRLAEHHVAKLELQPFQGGLRAALTEVIEEIPLRVEAHPAGASIDVDGRIDEAVAPATIRLRWSASMSVHQLRISHPGYEPHDLQITRDQARQPVRVRLVPLPPRSP